MSFFREKRKTIFLVGLLFIAVLVFVFFYFFPSEATLTNGANAINGLGQLDATGAVDYTKGEPNNGPNAEGFYRPSGAILDEINHRMYVVDSWHYRIMVYNLDASNDPLDYTADYVLGWETLFDPVDIFRESTADSLYRNWIDSGADAENGVIGYLALDVSGQRLFVADSGAILVFDVSSLASGMDATNILGYASFTESGYNETVSAATIREASGLAYDATHNRLYASDRLNNRVLVFDTTTITNGMEASYVLGQSDFTSSSAGLTAATMSMPIGLAYDVDNDRLFVDDNLNGRILVYDFLLGSELSNGRSADYVLGVADFETAGTPQSTKTIAYDSGRSNLYVQTNQYLNAYSVAEIVNGEAPVKSVNYFGASSYVSIYNQAFYSTSKTQLYSVLSDSGNYLNLIDLTDLDAVSTVDVMGLVDSSGASTQIGKASVGNNLNNGPNRFGLHKPQSVVVDPEHHRLFVGDTMNYRIVVFDLDENNQLVDYEADYALGATDADTIGSTSATASSVGEVMVMAYDESTDYLFVVDKIHNRVLVFDVATVASNESAVYVLGQPDFTSCIPGLSAQKFGDVSGLALDITDRRLFVSDATNDRILIFDITAIENYESAVNVLGAGDLASAGFGGTTQSSMDFPHGLAYDDTNNYLFVADTNNHRVLIFDVSTVTNGMNASYVLGADDFITIGDSTDYGMAVNPTFGLAYDSSGHRLFVADAGYYRVVVFDFTRGISNGMFLSRVLGQASLHEVSMSTSYPLGADDIREARGLYYDEANDEIYVTDFEFNRLLIFDAERDFPDTPSGCHIYNQTETELTVSWLNNYYDQDSFALEISTDGDVYESLITLDADVNQYVVSDLESATPYWFRVKSVNAVGSSGYLDCDSAWTQAYAPATPTLVSPVNSATSVALKPTFTFTTTSTDGDVYYQLEISDTANFLTTRQRIDVWQDGLYGQRFASGEEVNITLNESQGLSTGTDYYWRVRAIGIHGAVSELSAANHFTTLLPAEGTDLVERFDSSAHFSATNSGAEYRRNLQMKPSISFAAASDILGDHNTTKLLADDFDNDGDTDIVQGDRNLYYWSQSDGAFTGGSYMTSASDVSELGDFNNDGKTDYLFGSGGVVVVAISSGAGTIDNYENIDDTMSVQSAAVGDFNNDGTTDFVWTDGTTSSLRLNLGSLNFIEPAVNPFDGITGVLRAADVNGDHWLDVLVSGASGAVYLNDHDGTYTFVSAPWSGASDNMVVVDIDNDGDEDVVRGGGDLYLNRGTGVFVTGSIDTVSGDVTGADIDGNGLADLIFSNNDGVTLYRNYGNLDFGSGEELYSSAVNSSVVLDTNGDGLLDIVLAITGQNKVLRGQHVAGSDSVPELYKNYDFTSDEVFAIFDANNDGLNDHFARDATTGVFQLLVADGAGDFTSYGNYGSSSDPHKFLVTDITGDGYLDMVGVDWFTGMRSLYINLANNLFSVVTDAFSTEPGTSFDGMRAADLDADGFVDLIFAPNYGPLELWYGDGAGNFILNTDPMNVDVVVGSLDIGDVDSDGNLEVVAPYSDSIRFGEGATLNEDSLNSLRRDGVRLADFDLDGDLDLIAVGADGRFDFFANNSVGEFSAYKYLVVGGGINFLNIEILDFNNDGRPDVFLGDHEAGSINHLFINRGNLDFDIITLPSVGSTGFLNLTTGDIDNDGLSELFLSEYIDGVFDASYGFHLEPFYTVDSDATMISNVLATSSETITRATLTVYKNQPEDTTITWYLASAAPEVSAVWSAITLGITENINAVETLDMGDTVFSTAAGNGGRALLSVDYGAWADVSPPGVTTNWQGTIVFTSGVLLYGDGGDVYYSADGSEWVETCVGATSENLTDHVSLVDNSIFALSGDNGLVMSVDVSALPTITCTVVDVGISENINAMTVVGGVIVAVGDAGSLSVIEPSPPGSTLAVTGTANNLNDVAYYEDGDSYLIVVVGDSGTVFSFNYDGVDQVFDIGTTENLNSVFIPNLNTIVVAGESGSIFFTTDGGAEWIDISYLSDGFKSIFEWSDSLLAVAGSAGKMYALESYGLTTLWEEVTPGIEHTFTDAGGELRYKAVFNTLDDGRTPIIQKLQVAFTEGPGETYQCNDGLDNDDDGKIDYSDDPGCESATDDSESPDPGGPKPIFVVTAPAAQTPNVLSSTSIQWNFQDQANNETGFKIYDEADLLLQDVPGENQSYFIENSLLPDTQYSRKVSAYNSMNESAHVSLESVYTLANVPSITGTTVLSPTSVRLNLEANGNSTTTRYAVYSVGTSQWLIGNNTLGNTKTFKTLAEWGASGIEVLGLTNKATYTFKVLAKNGDNVETEYSTEASIVVDQPRANLELIKKVGINVQYVRQTFFGHAVFASGGKGEILERLPFFSKLTNGYLFGAIIFVVIFLLGLIFNASEKKYWSRIKYLRHTPRILFSDVSGREGDNIYELLHAKDDSKKGEIYDKHHRLYRYTGVSMLCLLIGVVLKILLVFVILVLVNTNIGVRAFINQTGDVVHPGDELTYRVEYLNNGQLEASNTSFGDVIPSGTEYLPGTANINGVVSGACSVSAGVLNCSLGNISSGAFGYVEFRTRVTATSGATIVNSANASFNGTLNAASNMTSNPVTVDLPQCNDDIDNDNDNLTDYPDDPGCVSLEDTSEGSEIFINDGQRVAVTVTDEWLLLNMVDSGMALMNYMGDTYALDLFSSNPTTSTSELIVSGEGVSAKVGGQVVGDANNNGIPDLAIKVLRIPNSHQTIVQIKKLTEVFQCTTGQVRTCTANNTCVGSQTCIARVWQPCTTTLNKCSDNSCQTTCPACFPGESRACTAANTCAGSQVCGTNGAFGTCLTELSKCDDNSCRASCFDRPTCNEGESVACIADNGCSGAQVCVNGIFGDCISELNKCSDNSCRVSCEAVSRCNEGDIVSCVAGNGCEGSQICTNGAFSSCNTNLNKCSDNSCQVSCAGITACTTGDQNPCLASNGCAGVQTCSDGVFGSCVASLNKCSDNSCREICPAEEVREYEENIDKIEKEIESLNESIKEATTTYEVASLTVEKILKQTNLVIATVIDNPVVQTVNQVAIALAVITFTAVGFVNVATAATAAGATSGIGLLSYLQFFAMQPILLLARRQRERWGIIYDSLTKKPVPLAIIRVFEKTTGRLVQTRVSDRNGRYQVIADKGEYYIEIKKDEYKFPSSLLYGQTQDVKYYGLYFGGTISVSDKQVLNYNIPIDPNHPVRNIKSELRAKTTRRLQYALSFVGPFGAVASLIIKPSWWVAGHLIVQVFLIYVFRRLAIPPKLRNWGVVTDEVTHKPISRAVVRIFDVRYNKLLESQVSDASGRYGFLVGKNSYYLTVEKTGFATAKSEPIEITDEAGGIIAQNIKLKKFN